MIFISIRMPFFLLWHLPVECFTFFIILINLWCIFVMSFLLLWHHPVDCYTFFIIIIHLWCIFCDAIFSSTASARRLLYILHYYNKPSLQKDYSIFLRFHFLSKRLRTDASFFESYSNIITIFNQKIFIYEHRTCSSL